MFGADSGRFTKTEGEALIDPGIALAAFSLVGDQHNRHSLSAQPARDFFIQRCQPDTRIEYEKRRIRTFQAHFGLLAHATGQGVGIIIFPPGCIDDLEIQSRNRRIAEPAIARNAGLIVDQRQPLAHKAVEQRRLTDIGPANDDHCRFGR